MTGGRRNSGTDTHWLHWLGGREKREGEEGERGGGRK